MQRAKQRCRTAYSAKYWLPQIEKFQSEFEITKKAFILCQKFACKHKPKYKLKPKLL